MPKTYTPIATQTLTTSAATVTLSSIPSTYTDLIAVMQPQLTVANNAIYADFNNDTATNYSWTALNGNGSTATSSRASNQGLASIANDLLYPNATAGATTIIINLQNYSNTTTNKTYIVRGGAASTGTQALVGLWRSTSAINSIKFYASASSFAPGSTFTLYGILKA